MQGNIIKNPIKRRLPYLESNVDGILLYGKDNLYPQRMAELLNRSGAGKGSVKLLAMFLRGAGFSDPALNTTIVNALGQTPRQLLREAIDDWSKHTGFALHVDYNAFLVPCNPTIVKFEHCRLGLPDENGRINKIVVSGDWAKEKNKANKKPQRVDRFNSNPEIVLKQIERAGGLENYKGQILYVTPNEGQYPLATFDEVVADVETDAQLSIFRENSVLAKFMADYIAEYPGEFADGKEKAKFEDNLAQFQGVENSGKIFLIENPHAPDKPFKLTKVDVQNNDNLFKWTEEAAQTKIRKNFTQPAILVGDLIPGRLGNTQEIENSFTFYNLVTHDDRELVAAAFEKLFKLVQGVTVTEVKIVPLTWALFVQLASGQAPTTGAPAPGVNDGLAGLKVSQINKIFSIGKKYKDGKISKEEALLLLTKTYGFTEDEAMVFLTEPEDTTTNE